MGIVLVLPALARVLSAKRSRGIRQQGTGSSVHPSLDAATLDRATRYDVRRVVPITAAILGGVGGFAVAAIVIVLTLAGRADPSLLTLAAGLLALSLIGCLTGSFALASLAAERFLTPNLTAAAMWMSIGPTIGVVATLAAFEVLAKMYVPEAASLFVLMTACAGIGGVLYNGFAPLDEMSEPRISASTWIPSARHAKRWTVGLCLLGSAPVLAGAVVCGVGAGIAPTSVSVTTFVGVMMVITIGCAAVGVIRTVPPEAGKPYRGLGRNEAILLQALLGTSLGMALVLLP